MVISIVVVSKEEIVLRAWMIENTCSSSSYA